MKSVILFPVVSLFWCGTLAAAEDLPARYRGWIEDEVKYIITKEERERALELFGKSLELDEDQPEVRAAIGMPFVEGTH